MDMKDINLLHRFVGVVEAVALKLPDDVQSLLNGYIEAVDAILNKEEKGGEQE